MVKTVTAEATSLKFEYTHTPYEPRHAKRGLNSIFMEFWFLSNY